jgi:hypothetical protein
MRKYAFEILLAAMVVFIATSCGVKTSATGSASTGLVQVFTKGKDSLLCFAGPIEYVAKNNKDKFEIDHTYLKVKDQSNPVVCNFSILSRDAQFRPNEISLELDGKKHAISNLNKLFAEGRGKKDFIYRYSFQVSDSLFYTWMKCESPVLQVNERIFTGEKKYRKGAEQVFRSFLFDLY